MRGEVEPEYDRGSYILRGHEAVPEKDLLTWAKWMETGERRVAHDSFAEYEISTIFIGLDMQHGRFINPALPPLLFETMVFQGMGRAAIVATERCSTWDQAVAQHARIAARFRVAVSN
jgi:hypothetical protein